MDPIEDRLGPPSDERWPRPTGHEHRRQGDDVEEREGHEPASDGRDLRPLDLVQGGQEEQRGSRSWSACPAHRLPRTKAAEALVDGRRRPRPVLLAGRAAAGSRARSGQRDQQPGADQLDESIPERVDAVPTGVPWICRSRVAPQNGVDSEHDRGRLPAARAQARARRSAGPASTSSCRASKRRADGRASGQRQDGRRAGHPLGHAIGHPWPAVDAAANPAVEAGDPLLGRCEHVRWPRRVDMAPSSKESTLGVG